MVALQVIFWGLFILSLVVFLVVVIRTGDRQDSTAAKKQLHTYWFIPAIMLILAITSLGFVQIPTGYRGVHLRVGAMVGSMNEGLNLIIPFVDEVKPMSVKTQKYEETATAASKDLQDAITSIAINYRIDAAYVGDVLKSVGEDYIKVIASPAIQEVTKMTTSEYDASDLILKRSAVKDSIDMGLTKRLEKYHIIVEQVSITNFKFSEQFTAAIESKVSQQQAVAQAQFKLEQVKIEAQQAEAVAKGQAAASIANAEGQAKSIQLITDAQVAANNKISETLNDKVLQYIYIDRLNKNVTTMVIPNNIPITLAPVK